MKSELLACSPVDTQNIWFRRNVEARDSKEQKRTSNDVLQLSVRAGQNKVLGDLELVGHGSLQSARNERRRSLRGAPVRVTGFWCSLYESTGHFHCQCRYLSSTAALTPQMLSQQRLRRPNSSILLLACTPHAPDAFVMNARRGWARAVYSSENFRHLIGPVLTISTHRFTMFRQT